MRTSLTSTSRHWAAERSCRVAGNLPYNVSSPILFDCWTPTGRPVWSDATLMLQREVADRMTAAPGTGDYGVLSILFSCTATFSG